MTNVNKIKHLKKANKIKAIQNLPKFIARLRSEQVTCCKTCNGAVGKQGVITHYGKFCSENCKDLHYDHYILPDIEAAREHKFEYEKLRREASWV